MIVPPALTVLALGAFASSPLSSLRPDEVRFDGARRTLWLDRTEVIAFRVAAGEARSFAAQVGDPTLVEIVGEPAVLADREVGFLRVRSLEAGETRLTVGDASVALRVAPSPSQAPTNGLEARIVSPVADAAVWGRFAVGVEVPVGHATAPLEERTVRLTLGARELEPVRVLPSAGGLIQRAVFEIDADALPPGPLALTATVSDARGAQETTEPLHLLVVHPTDVTSGECEDLALTERPDQWGDRFPAVGGHPAASGGAYVSMPQPDPVWILPVEVEAEGRYQLFLRVRGHAARGAFPSVGVGVDSPAYPRTAARVVDRGWHRLAVGKPFVVEAGAHHLAVRFLNDVAISTTIDRNLDLDRYELARVEELLGDADAGDGAMMMMSSGGAAGGRTGLWIAFDRPLDGQVVNGVLQFSAHARWRDFETVAAPTVQLLVNGAILDVQQAARPTFHVDPGALRAGENELQLIARLEDGRRAEAPVQRVVLEEEAAAPPRDIRSFSVLDERWLTDVTPFLTGRDQEAGHRVVQVQGQATLELSLPDELSGTFDCVIDARGTNGPAGHVSVKLVSAVGEQPREPVAVQNWWNARSLGTLELDPGAKRLVLAVDTTEATAAGDPIGFHLRALRLIEAWPAPDRTPPRVRVLYPAAGHVAHGVDGVVARAYDDRAVQSAEVVLDGTPLGVYSATPRSTGDLFIPLPLRDVSPGEHQLAVRVQDEAGNVGESLELAFTVLEDEPAQPGAFARAVRLLDRFAYGPDPAELAEVLTAGEEAWLRGSLTEPGAGDAAVLGYVRALRGENVYYDLDRSVIAHAIRTPNPAHLRFAMFVQNHFSTWVGKTGVPAEWFEHELFTSVGTAPFGELLTTSATSPVMNWYLDQHQSFASRLNENYAREILELHTLGVDGGYTQAEVTELAGLLSGLTLSQETPLDGRGDGLSINMRFAPDLGDGRPRELLGLRFEETPPHQRLDRLRHALELLVAHPSTARFVARKLAEHYVAAPAPAGLVDELALVFTESGGDPRALLPAIAEHPSFWAETRPARLRNPFELGVRLGRVTEVPQVDWAVREYLHRSGMGVSDRVTPDGYPEEDAAWVDTNALMQRWRLPETVRWATRSLVPDRMRGERSTDEPAWRQRVVDVAAIRLTGRALDDESNAAAVAFLADSEGPVWRRVDETAVLICRLPEASLK